MAYLEDTGKKQDFAVGLLAVSSHQGGMLSWHHSPSRKVSEQPNGFVVAPDQATHLYLMNNLGDKAGRASRVPILDQFTGHTAIFIRIKGKIDFVRGFVPNGFLRGLIGTGLGTPFAWDVGGIFQDDQAMLKDPTCIGYEIQVEEKEAIRFYEIYKIESARMKTYSIRSGDANSEKFNCVLAAVELLKFFLEKTPGKENEYAELSKFTGTSQGKLYTAISTRFTQEPKTKIRSKL